MRVRFEPGWEKPPDPESVASGGSMCFRFTPRRLVDEVCANGDVWWRDA